MNPFEKDWKAEEDKTAGELAAECTEHVADGRTYLLPPGVSLEEAQAVMGEIRFSCPKCKKAFDGAPVGFFDWCKECFDAGIAAAEVQYGRSSMYVAGPGWATFQGPQPLYPHPPYAYEVQNDQGRVRIEFATLDELREYVRSLVGE